MSVVNELKDLGFSKAASTVEKKRELKRRMTIAYEHFRFVTQEQVDGFNKALKERTIKREGQKGLNLVHRYDKLAFVAPADYPEVPPAEVLGKMREAKALGCFDTFEIAKIDSVVEYKDPIVFGRINGCKDRFFVAQWDDDCKIEDILGELEG